MTSEKVKKPGLFRRFVAHANAFADEHQFDGEFGGARIDGDQIKHEGRWYPMAGATATAGNTADLGKRLTLTRVALVGPLAMLAKKDRGIQMHVLVELADGDHLLITDTAKTKDGDVAAHQFASTVTRAGRHFAAR